MTDIMLFKICTNCGLEVVAHAANYSVEAIVMATEKLLQEEKDELKKSAGNFWSNIISNNYNCKHIFGPIKMPNMSGNGHFRSETISALVKEGIRARTKFPGNRFLLAALMEEVGELAQALLQNQSREEVIKEAIQVSNVALRIAEEGDASFADITEDESKK